MHSSICTSITIRCSVCANVMDEKPHDISKDDERVITWLAIGICALALLLMWAFL